MKFYLIMGLFFFIQFCFSAYKMNEANNTALRLRNEGADPAIVENHRHMLIKEAMPGGLFTFIFGVTLIMAVYEFIL